MTELNDRAAEALRPFEPNAVTDVTGFGLFGHAREMAERSGVRIVLERESIPALPARSTPPRRGVRTGGDQRNREFAAGCSTLDGVPDELVALAFDPQTSGGLLVSLPADKAPSSRRASRTKGSSSRASAGSRKGAASRSPDGGRRPHAGSARSTVSPGDASPGSPTSRSPPSS